MLPNHFAGPSKRASRTEEAPAGAERADVRGVELSARMSSLEMASRSGGTPSVGVGGCGNGGGDEAKAPPARGVE
ncbi:hypothetical protein GUJ93_ZPchr0003g16991 [Zizania palustris]|uniref:Uncharacterized protein n=1 Tax=Zizania palustris TaxID=103762 RepID=A0A8J5VXD7_ZIZPA|nr:hypothetical protein GUJ93_ZPchr0109g40560 [Zizania palustris]KAG8062164.1 hypothetical protein GUJ93_ZPchr0003g16991 [Zizania palustris]